ncbi:hybrid sensor histidine kinase/response regulator [Fluviicola taffensis]|uniref:hybrid sensor histidine kinase/response regulator n=1 Tax=Fluviicola taffensis TaxID=191579 RepID=UPI00313782D4
MDYTPKILIVDDNIENLKVVGNILQSEKFDIAVSLNGESAINILLNNEIDLILMDIMMPEIDGLETCRRIKCIDSLKEIPLIFLTAKAQTNDILEAFEAGGVDYIFKPFNRLELLARVNTHLDLFLSKRKLKELYKNRDFIYSIIAHDIKSPFNKITQFLQMLNEGYLDKDSGDYEALLDLLNTETQKTNELIDELIEWGQLLMNENHNQLQSKHLKPIIDSVITFLEHQSSSKALEIQNNIDEKAKIICDERSIEVIFRNLLANAIKFTPDGGKITFSNEENTQKVFIQLKDSGIGMTKEVLEKIFENNEFYKTNGTNKEKGFGLGLLIIKDFVKKNNAELKVDSISEEGTTFTVIIDKSI